MKRRLDALRSSGEPHHHKRRAIALAAIAACALVLGISAGATGSSAHHIARAAVWARRAGAMSVAGAESAAIDKTLRYTPLVRVAGAQHREIALTFDDGPGPYTALVLAALARHQVPATFFEVGVLERYFHASTEAIVARGDTIGDHTMAHAPMGRLSPSDQQLQLLEQTEAIGQYGAPFPRLFRPPWGSWNRATLRLLHRYRMLMVLWTVDTSDYARPGVAAIVHSVLSQARPGAIILLHDAGGNRQQTVKALPPIINGLLARGYKLVTVPRLLLDNPPPADQDVPASLAGAGR